MIMDSKSHILVVDDDPNNGYFLSEVLKGYYATSLASNGKEALALAREINPDLVLLDVAMPIMNGYDVCKALKDDLILKDIPVIFLSAIHSTEKKVKGFEVGGVDYITKPFHIPEVLARVKTHLGLREAQRELQQKNERLQAEVALRIDAERKLTKSEEKYRLLFEKTRDAVLIMDLDFVIREVNQQAVVLFGYPIDEMINRPGRDFIVPEDEPDAVEKGERLRTGEKLAPYMRKFVRKNGTIRIGELNLSLIHDDDGNPLYFHNVVRDITERKELQDALKESERRYREILENTGEAVFATDTYGFFTYVNQVMIKRADLSEEELIGMHFTELIDKEWQQTVMEFYGKQLLERVEETIFAFPLVNKIGSEQVWVEQTTNFIRDGDRITGFLGITRDITERRKIEAEREQLIAELDAFAHTVAHDLKTPLSALKLYGDILNKMYNKMSAEKRQDIIQSIQSVTDKMHSIIEALLLLSSVRKQSDIAVHQLEMKDIIAEAEKRLKAQIEAYNAEYTIADDFPVTVGYAPWIEEIWVNYMSNAIKYGGTPPKFEVGADRLDDRSVRFWIKDNGKGLLPEEQSQLFTPFTRLDKVNIDGHGLGLSIIQRITEKLNGHVGIESEVGYGSTFYFVLPTANLDSAS